MKRINDKIVEIEKYIEEFSALIPSSFNEYKDNMVKAACERYVEKIVESLTDLAFLVIKYKRLKLPEDDIHAFKILFDDGVIEENLFSNLKLAKGMRNIIAHQYGDIDDKIVFDSLGKLIEDSEEFIKKVNEINK